MRIEGGDFNSPEFRHGVWSQTATTVAMLTSAASGQADVMACEWAMMVSAKPLHFVVSVGPRKMTHELITASGEFGLNFCSDDQARLSHISGSYSLRDVDKWSMGNFVTYRPTKIEAPMIEGCTLNVECRLVTSHELGSHTLFVGEALWARCDAERSPLIYHSGKYWHLGKQVAKT